MTPLDRDSRILVVDDEDGMRDLLDQELKSMGYQVFLARNGQEALEVLSAKKCHLVLTDMRMPNMDGLVLLEKIKVIDPTLEVIVMTGHGTIEDAVTAMKKGAYDFVLKPFSLDEIRELISKALEKKSLKGILAIYESAKQIMSAVHISDLTVMIIEVLIRMFEADAGSLMLVNEKGKLAIMASHGISEKVAQETQLEIGERVAGKVAQTKKEILLINGLDRYPEFKDLKKKSDIASSMICPLVSVSGDLLGVLNLSRTRNRENFTQSDLQAAAIFASISSLAISNAKLFERLEIQMQELQETQDRLLQAEKLASVGRLVAGVAHELNNPLTSVIGYSQLAVQAETPEDMKRSLTIINEQAVRCSRIVKDLLYFSRQKKIVRESCDLYDLVDKTLKALDLEFKKREVEIIWTRPDHSLILDLDACQIRQVLSNLLTNAFQALESVKGKRRIEIQSDEQAYKVCLKICDNGPGIPADAYPRIFDPFFTTKDIGQGTGLGLSLSYGIVKEHEGVLYAERNMGRGAVFILELPVQNKAVSFSQRKAG